MKKKKGFTLIEIIICIGMLAVIAVGSIVGINLVNKNLIIKELNQITNKAIQAAQVYIGTNKAAQTQLYTEQNAVKIPIKVLVNEGLLSLKGTKLDEKNIENEYVITALSTESSTSTECTNIDSKASWDNDKVIYICTNLNNKGEVTGSNLATIDPSKYSNKTYVSNEPYYFKGMDPNNYVKLNFRRFSKGPENEVGTFRIIYIDRNDDIIIKSQADSYFFSVMSKRVSPVGFICMTDSGVENQKFVDSNYIHVHCSSWLGKDHEYINDKIYINRLTNVKIISGTGAKDNPFILENKS